MLDEYTFSSAEMLRQKIGKILHGKSTDVVSFQGKFRDFKAACEICGSGYGSDSIFEKVKNASLAVKEGKAAYERDGYLFYKKEYYLQLLTILYEVFFEYGECNVIDFGGSLGSTFFQNKDKLLRYIPQIKWDVVEQRHFVDWGKEYLEDENLKFHYTIHEVDRCNLVLFGSSLQYLEDYHVFLKQVADRGIKYLIIDRLPVSNEIWVSVEYVHEPIYEASYPLYILCEDEMIREVNSLGYRLETVWIKDAGEVWQVENKLIKEKTFLFVKEEKQNADNA